ncbi:MAG: TerC family protein [Gemmatimonadaceae bacterium]|nr:TerC family protein [Gemmatimonadaceae bacterium]
MQHAWMWAAFGGIVITMLALDLGVFHRSAHRVSPREAATWSAVWVSLALAFAGGLWAVEGERVALEFLAGYVVEEALSVDNLFVFLLLFSYFKVPEALQHRVLFWGIIGALLMRGVMIGLGAVLLARFHWIIYLFGAFLVLTGIKMFLQQDGELEPERNPVVLVLVETTDVVFAVDSIPAVFGVTRDPFIVFTSNIFAILGLRSLYFLLAAVVHRFWLLKPALSLVLIFVGGKMLVSGVYHVPIGVSLAVIVTVLGGAVGLSLAMPRAAEAPAPAVDAEVAPTDAGRTTTAA